MRGHSGKVLAVEWSSTNEHILASAGSDGTLRLWDIRKASACIGMLDQYNSRLAIRPQIPKAHSDTINGLAWSSDDLTLLSTGHDNKLRAWNMQTGENLLVNFGTAINNSHWQNLKPLIIDKDIEDPIVFYPSDEGLILRYSLLNGHLWHRQFVLNGRVTCVVDRPRHTEIFSGDSAGHILRWAPHITNVQPETAAESGSRPENILDTIASEGSRPTVTFSWESRYM